MKFYVKNDKSSNSVEVRDVDDFVVLFVNDEEVAYFNNTGLVLLPGCGLPDAIMDSSGYLVVNKVM